MKGRVEYYQFVFFRPARLYAGYLVAGKGKVCKFIVAGKGRFEIFINF
ncbi:MAG: hypothetical protein WCA84_16600 [Ignavibacteriaceae bacterium]